MTKKEKYSLIKPGKSHVMVNPSIGCGHTCIYCNGKRNEYTERHSPEETLFEIISSNEISKDKSSLLLYGFSDPFLPQNTKGLVKILEGLDNMGWSNKVSLITKLNPGEEALSRIGQLRNMRPVVFVSYTNMVQGIESPSVNERLELMYSLFEKGIPVVAYLSPLVEEWTSLENIAELSDEIKGRVNAATLSGVTLNPQIISELKEKGIEIPKVPTMGGKYDNEDFFRRVEKTIHSRTELPTFRSAFKTISHIYEAH